MLTSALSFLSDKRRRFQRSDTMPAFGSEAVTLVVANEKPSKELPKLEPLTKDFPSGDQQDLKLVTQNAEKPVTITREEILTDYASFNFMDGDELSSSDEETCTMRHQSGQQKMHLTTSTADLLTLPLLSYSSTAEVSPNPYARSKSPSPFSYTSSNSPRLDQNLPPASESYLCEESNVPSFGSNQRTLFRKVSRTSSQKAFFPSVVPLAEQPVDFIGQVDDRFIAEDVTIQTKTKISPSRNKSKLHRSNSSAQVSLHFSDEFLSKGHRGRSISSQRQPSDMTEGTFRRQRSVDRKRRVRKRGKTLTERGPRSRSVASSNSKIDATCEAENTNSYSPLLQIPFKGTVENHFEINATEHFPCSANSDNKSSEFNEYTQFGLMGVQSLQPEQSTSSQQSIPQNNQLSLNTHTKLSKYAVMKRLRRNNSSLNWSSEKFAHMFDTEESCPSSNTAGDLLLPIKIKQRCRTESDPLLQTRDHLFSLIRRDDIIQIMQDFSKLKSLSDSIQLEDLYSCDEAGVSHLECALLLASPQLAATLMALGFQPGPILRSALTNGPSNMRLLDPIKFHLIRRIGDAEAQLTTVQSSLKQAINNVNQFNALASGFCKMNETQNDSVNLLFTEVSLKEREMTNSMENRDYLIRLYNGLERYPTCPLAPRKVCAIVSGANSISLRISPPTSITYSDTDSKQNFESDSTNYHNESQDSFGYERSACDLTDEENEATTIENQPACSSGRSEFSDLILRYRIEWSSSSDFEESETFAHTVQPPIRTDAILSNLTVNLLSNSVKKNGFIRTGYYDLTGLPSGETVYIRVYAFSIRGWSDPCYSQPRATTPSAWYQVKGLRDHKSNKDLKEFLGDEGTQLPPPIRFVGKSLDDEFRSLKQLLDQQILLWSYKQPAGGCGADPSSSNQAVTEEVTKRTKSPRLQRKRSFRFLFTTKNLKFVKQTKSGVYLALLCHDVYSPFNNVSISMLTDKKQKSQILLFDDALPMVNVTKEEYTASPSFNADINWFARLVADPTIAPDLELISEHLLRSPSPINLQFRIRLLAALHRIQLALGCADVGTLYPEFFCGRVADSLVHNRRPSKNEHLSKTTDDIMETSTHHSSCSIPNEVSTRTHSTVILVLVKHLKRPTELCFSGGLKWCSMRKFIRQNKITFEALNPSCSDSYLPFQSTSGQIRDDYRPVKMHPYGYNRLEHMTMTPELHLLSNLDGLLHYSQYHNIQLSPGLYVAIVQMQAHLDQQPTILVSKASEAVHMLPIEKVRTLAHVSREEWSILNNLCALSQVQTLPSQNYTFCKSLLNAWYRLSRRLKYTKEEAESFRIYLPEVIEISPKHSIILIFPPIDQVCLPPGHPASSPAGCFWSSMSHFERNASLTYDPVFQTRVSSLLSILEILVPMSQFLQRQCLNELELAECSERTNALQSIQQQVESHFQSKRWLSDAISVARDRKRLTQRTLPVANVNAFVNPESEITPHVRPYLGSLSDTNNHIIDSDRKAIQDVIGQLQELNDMKKSSCENKMNPCQAVSNHTLIDALKVLSKMPPDWVYVKDLESKLSVLRVFADYPCGLARGTSVKMLISLHTTARDIVGLVVTKLTEIAKTKTSTNVSKRRAEFFAHPQAEYLTPDQYLLTVSIGHTEQTIPNLLRPLLLQEPWRSGKFAVRQIKDIPDCVNLGSLTCHHVNLNHSSQECDHEKGLAGGKSVTMPIRSAIPNITRVPSPFNIATSTPPPIVYVDGCLIKYS